MDSLSSSKSFTTTPGARPSFRRDCRQDAVEYGRDRGCKVRAGLGAGFRAIITRNLKFLFYPPKDLCGKCTSYHRYDPETRKLTLLLTGKDSCALRLSTGTWMLAHIRSGPCSTKRRNHLLYNLRGFKIGEGSSMAQT